MEDGGSRLIKTRIHKFPKSLHKEFNYLYSSPNTFKIEKNVMDGACNTYGGEERRTQDFGGET